MIYHSKTTPRWAITLSANLKPTTMSQNQKIANYLNKGRKLTPIDALNKFGCFRLAARIADLRNQGLNIETTIIKLKNNKQVAQYWLN
jgi:anaerobic glycerol-3-phosphate dehydrogenase